MSKPKNKPTKPNHQYKVTLGVNQRENVNKAANAVDETPVQFMKNSSLAAASTVNAAANIVGKK